MHRRIGIVVDSVEPTSPTNKDIWVKPVSGGLEFYGWNDDTQSWVLEESIQFAIPEHEHGDLNDIVTLLSNGVTGTKNISGHQVTFNHGVLVDYQPPA